MKARITLLVVFTVALLLLIAANAHASVTVLPFGTHVENCRILGAFSPTPFAPGVYQQMHVRRAEKLGANVVLFAPGRAIYLQCKEPLQLYTTEAHQ